MRVLDRDAEPIGDGGEREVLFATVACPLNEEREPEDVDDLLPPPGRLAPEHPRQERRFDLRRPREHVPSRQGIVQVVHDHPESRRLFQIHRSQTVHCDRRVLQGAVGPDLAVRRAAGEDPPPSIGTTPNEMMSSPSRSRPVVSKSSEAYAARRQGPPPIHRGRAGGAFIGGAGRRWSRANAALP